MKNNRQHASMLQLGNYHSGFSLIEVLVALSILAIGVAGSFRLLGTGYEHLSITQNYSQAAHFADTHLSRLQAKKTLEDLGPDFQTGRYNPHLRWELSLNPMLDNPFSEGQDQLSQLFLPVRADLAVFVEGDSGSQNFHSLLVVQKTIPLQNPLK